MTRRSLVGAGDLIAPPTPHARASIGTQDSHSGPKRPSPGFFEEPPPSDWETLVFASETWAPTQKLARVSAQMMGKLACLSTPNNRADSQEQREPPCIGVVYHRREEGSCLRARIPAPLQKKKTIWGVGGTGGSFL